MTYRALIIALLLLFPALATAQLETAHWYFGEGAGLDFRGGAPVARTDGEDHTWEGIATMSDRTTGAFLFHTDGDTVWNRHWRIMPNGTGMGAHKSSTQGALIIPQPEDPTKFIIVSTDAGDYYNESPLDHHGGWSIVDMALDGGNGAVTSKLNILHGPIVEKVAAVPHCSGRGYWVIFHESQSSRYVVYYLTEHGFGEPRFFDVGQRHGGPAASAIGGMKFSPDGTKLATAIFSARSVDVLDFDRRTGTLSNPVTLDAGSPAYDVCFSPDGTKLYVAGEVQRTLMQFDLAGGTEAAIQASRFEVFRSTRGNVAFEYICTIQKGLDDRLYVAIRGERELGVIVRPNLAGAACGYQHRAIPLADRYATAGLPNFIYGAYDETLETCRPPRAIFDASSLEICTGESVTFTDRSVDNPSTWVWRFDGGDPSTSTGPQATTVRYASAGVFRATLVTENPNGADTAWIDITVHPRPVIEAGEEKIICIGDGVQIGAGNDPAARYAWSPSTGLSCADCPAPVASPSTTTRYTVVATSSEGCTSSDEVTVVVEPFPAVDAGEDVAICIGDTVELDGRGGTELVWSPAAGLSCTTCANPIASPAVTTTYTLATSNNGRCVSIDSVTVTVGGRPVASAGSDVAVCRGEPVQLRATGGVRYEWSPSTGLSCADCAEPTVTAEETTVYTVRAFNALGCPDEDEVVVIVDPAPRVVEANLGPTQSIYPGERLELPVILAESLDSASVSMIDIVVEYDPTIMHMLRATLDSTLTEGWTAVVTAEDRAAGRFALRLFAISGATLHGTGVIARLHFQSFINRGDSSLARLSVTLPGKECTRVDTEPVLVKLDGVCGLNHRLLDVGNGTYALRGAAPNPFNPSTTIDFSLGLDGPTLVEVLDAGGRRVATLVDEHLAAGSYALVWDASAHPSGLYYCRITSGAWTRTMTMMLAK